MKPIVLISLFFIICIYEINARILSRCDLAKEFRQKGIFTEVELPNFVCIAEAESRGNTSAIRGPGWDGSYDYGLFLVSDNYWCNHGAPGKGCNVACVDLITEDVTSAANCAKIVYNIHGFTAWQSWSQRCNGHLPDLSSCY